MSIPDVVTPVADTQPGGDSQASPDTTPDGGGQGTDTAADTTPTGPCNGFGCPCTSNADCLDELCVETADGFACTETCVTACPDTGYSCLPITLGGSDPFNACVPQHPNLCKPCLANADCRNALVPGAPALCLAAAEEGTGSFCASSCENGIPCPGGYRCDDVALDGGGSAKQCVPEDGQCDCRPAWASLDLRTDCAVSNDAGTCRGTRTCGAEGLTACDAATPTEEVCDLSDNDCDMATDEGTCDDALACTTDVCSGVDSCDNQLQSGFCVIDGACIPEGTSNPGATCQACVPASSTTSWTDGEGGNACFINDVCFPAGTPKPGEPCFECRPDLSSSQWSPVPEADAKRCDDGTACTAGDTCGNGLCRGQAYSCNDDKSCTADICVGDGTCDFLVMANSCLIDGTCYATDQRPDDTTCLVCAPDNNVTGWSPPTTALSCDDGAACTHTDVCDGATCGGTDYEASCDDQLACTSDGCEGDGTCSHDLVAGHCVIQGVCYATGAAKPGDPCFECRPDSATDQWSAVPAGEAKPCSDGVACTSGDVCGNGLCRGTAYSCGDGKDCTEDVCLGDGGCAYPVKSDRCLIGETCFVADDRPDATSCRVCAPSIAKSAWSAPSTAISCDDGQACTHTDVCAGSVCGGTDYAADCEDGLSCTDDSCLGDGTCAHALVAGTCKIGAACYGTGDENPNNRCQTCDAATVGTAWTNVPTAAAKSCNDAVSCTHTDICRQGECAGTPYVCSDGKPCTQDGVCTGVPDGCDFPVADATCLIDGTCYEPQDRVDEDACNACVPKSSQTAWSPAPAAWALACDDGEPCSVDDVCGAAGCAGAGGGDCDDDLFCTIDSCDGAGGCVNTRHGGHCIIGDACYAHEDPNPDNPCEVCDVFVNPLRWTTLHDVAPEDGCDDGDPCTPTGTEICNRGECVSDEVVDCDDGNACTVDSCDPNVPGVCVHTLIEDPVEVCDNGIDDDCDGITDEGELEQCGDLVDNDCDGITDESGSTWGELFFARSWTNDAGLATVAIYTSEGGFDFSEEKVLTFPDGRHYGIISVGDYDGDGFLDLMVSAQDNGAKQACTATANCPSGHICSGRVCTPNCTTIGAFGTATRDSECPVGDQCLDNNEQDGNKAATNFCVPPSRVYLARERCPDGAVELLEMAHLAPGQYVGPIIDADNNGHLDLVIRKNWQTRTGDTLLNDGAFNFARVTDSLSMAGFSCGWVYSISRTSKDLNGDGLVDLIGYCNPSGGDSLPNMWYWGGRGDGTFDVGVGFSPKPLTPLSLLTTNDFDGDGDQDIIAGLDDDGQPGLASLMLNLGAADAQSWVNGYGVFDVAPGHNSGGDEPGVGNGTSFDFNGDSYPDILVGYVPEDECSYAWTCQFADIAVVPNTTANPCGAGKTCVDNACQVCRPFCGGRTCGGDGCGGSCGVCERGDVCAADSGQCVKRDACTPSCGAKTCGSNGCGGVCGYCEAGDTCVGGACVSNCVPNCAGKACGSDGCGGTCAIFGDPIVLETDRQSRGVVAPSNAPPTAPTIVIVPASPTSGDDLACLTQTPSYDLDAVRLEYRWFLNGSYSKEAGDRRVIPAALTGSGQRWRCEVRATDGREWSPFAAPHAPGANVVDIE